MTLREAIARLLEGGDLSCAKMRGAMLKLMGGAATPAQIAGFLVALRMKGETLDEITGAVEVMRELCTPVAVTGEHLIDIVGTGGDGAGLFNVSTASALVVAVCGGRVVKHGNRGVSSSSGSAALSGCDGNGYGRFNPPTSLVLWDCWYETDLWALLALGYCCLCFFA